MEALYVILPVSLAALAYLWLRARRSVPDIPAEPLDARPSDPPTVPVRPRARGARTLLRPPTSDLGSLTWTLADAGISNPLRHVLGAPVLECEDLRKTPSGGLWEARVMGGQRVVFELLGDAPQGGRERLHLAAFAVDAETWPTEGAYAASDSPVTLGTLVLDDEVRDYGQDPRPLCVLAATVSQARDDGDVQRALAAVPGGPLVVVGAPPGLLGTPVPDGVIAGTFWLCGRAAP